MEGKATYLKKRLNLFIKVVQYISGLTGSQNIWTETSKIVVNRLKADVAGFAWTGSNKRIITDYWTFSNKFSSEKILTTTVRKKIKEVLKSGFVDTQSISIPEKYSLAFLPVKKENKTASVMLIGYRMAGEISLELLDIYLGVAGIAGTMDARLQAENVSIDKISELKKATEEIKNLSEIQKTLIENIPVLEYNVSPDGKILDCNKLTLKTLGYKNKDELIGKPLNTTIYAPSSREKAKKLFLKWKKQSWLKDEEIEIITKKGKILDVILNVNTLYDTNGKVLSTISTQLDITERKIAEEELRVSRDHYRNLFSNMLEGFAHCKMLFDANGRPIDWIYLSVNKAFEPLTGLKNITGKKVTEAIPGIKNSNPELFEIYSRVALTGKPEGFENYIFPLSIWLHISVFSPANGEFVAVFQNITKRKKAEEEIKNLAKFPSENPNPVLRIDKTGKVIYSNKAGKIQLRKLGSKAGSKAPKILYDIVARLFKEKSYKPETVDINLGERVYEFVIAVVKDKDYANLYGRDITKRKKAESELKESYSKLQEALNGTINTLASIVEIRDPYTSGHQKNVALLATSIAEELGLDKNIIEAIGIAALIHDIGKINIPPSILARPGKISDLEYSLIKTHPQVGYDMIKDIQFPWPIADFVLQHHERLNGSGYPKGLKEKDIILEARVLAVADVVEAMASHRPYRPALGIDKALKEIKKGMDKLYDTKVVEACVKIIAKKGFKFLSG